MKAAGQMTQSKWRKAKWHA